LSDFAREFYAAGADVAVPEPAGPSSSSESTLHALHSDNLVINHLDPPDSLSSVHNPPPGPPPPRFAPPPGVPPPGPSSGSSSNRNDGRPTTIPTPGRPLQNKGRVLVYPAGHECRKCGFEGIFSHIDSTHRHTGNNTGYKNYDPSHPCKKVPWVSCSLCIPRSSNFVCSAGRNTENHTRARLHTRPGTPQLIAQHLHFNDRYPTLAHLRTPRLALLTHNPSPRSSHPRQARPRDYSAMGHLPLSRIHLVLHSLLEDQMSGPLRCHRVRR
jgi:hypothetical protein